MNRLGLGLLARPQIQPPPLPGNVVALFDPLFGIASSGGVVDSWTARFGTGLLTAAGGVRPALGADYLEFDGIDDVLSGAALALGGLAGATLGFWLRQTGPLANAVPVETSDFPTGLLVVSGASFVDCFSGSAQVARSTGPVTANSWTFFALTFDGAAGAGLKTKLFAGATPGAVANVTSFDNTANTTLPAPTGNTRIGGRSTVFFPGRIGIVAAYNTPLSLPQIQALAAYRIPA